MGFPVSVTVANLVMEEVEQKKTVTTYNSTPPIFGKDIWMILVQQWSKSE